MFGFDQFRNRFTRNDQSGGEQDVSEEANNDDDNDTSSSNANILFYNSLGRIYNISPTNREALLAHLRELSIIRSRRRMRYSDLSDDENENNHNENEMDFRTYPISINWYEVENDKKDYFGILEKFGYIGVALYSALDTYKGIKLTSDHFLFTIFEFFSNLYKNSKSEETLNNFIKILPSPKLIKSVISKKQFMMKEICVFVVLFKIFEIYHAKYDIPTYEVLGNEVMAGEQLFCDNITEGEWRVAYEEIKGNENLEKIATTMNSKFYPTKQMFINHLKILKSKLNKLVNGITKDKFIM